MLQTEFPFTLPCGYIDDQGSLHRQGVMRRATAIDEVEALASPRVRANEAYLSILLLSRVLIQLGPLRSLSPTIIEQLFASDFVYLQELYAQVNGAADTLVRTSCPTCGTQFALDLSELHEHA